MINTLGNTLARESECSLEISLLLDHYQAMIWEIKDEFGLL
jgi:hypothetical protein